MANRIAEAIDAIGDRERVLAGTDCGFGTFAGSDMVAGDVVWAKLATLAEGRVLRPLAPGDDRMSFTSNERDMLP